MAHLLEVKNLETRFNVEGQTIRAVDRISYYVDEGEIVGLVGESGSGKSVSQLSILQLISMPPGEIVGGEAILDGVDLLKLGPDSEAMRGTRGKKVGFIFQEPMTSLNPVLTVGKQIVEVLMLHLRMNRKMARQRAIELLKLVGIPDACHRIDDYPHQFSGGMRQRVMIAMAMSCDPKLLIADEPTTALDVTTQAQLLKILRDMVGRFKTSLLIVTHNLGVVARYAQRIYVMYAGRIVESGTAEQIFKNPKHPYTIGLLKCVPRLDEPKNRKLVPIEGLPPNCIRKPKRCLFYPRCTYRTDECKKRPSQELRHVDGSHYVACQFE
jgi:oligopeptide/dipeptide ABC transporter ATP-binding protein